MSNGIIDTTPPDGRRELAPSRPKPGGSFKRETSLIIKVELGELQQFEHEPAPKTSETPKKPAAVARRQSRRISIHDGDIELIEFSSYPAVRDWTRSTEHLVPCSTTTSNFEDVGQKTSSQPIAFGSSPGSLLTDREMPDYKPIPLRTSFLAFLFLFIAGTFAFLEYQVHDLPPMRYSVMNLDVLGRTKQRIQTEFAEFDKTVAAFGSTVTPSSQSPRTNDAGSFITITRAAPGRRAMLAPKPEPDPRPPDTAYPSPAAPVSYCGWYAPQWTVQSNQVKATPCDQLPHDQPGYNLCPGNETGEDAALYYRQWDLHEGIQTFVTNDSSWCPCRASLGRWGSEEIEDELKWLKDWWDTDDEGCKSVMVAIESINYYKWGRIYTPATATTEWPYRNEFYSYTTPPAQASSQIWPLPSTKAGGDIMLPMVVRAAGTEIMDVFGNKVKPTETATFPFNFYSRPPWGPGRVPTTLPCFLASNMYFGYMEECTALPVSASMSLLWWQLPLSRPTSTSAGTTGTVLSTTTTDVVGISLVIVTTTAQQGSSIPQQPLCTSCETSNMKTTPVATSGPASKTSTSKPSLSDSSTLVGFVTSTTSSGQRSVVTTTLLPSMSAPTGPESGSEARFMTVEPETSSAQRSGTTSLASSSTSPILVPIGIPVPDIESFTEPTTSISSTMRLSKQSVTISGLHSQSEPWAQTLATESSSGFDAEHTSQITEIQNQPQTQGSMMGASSVPPRLRPSPRPSQLSSPGPTIVISLRPSPSPFSHHSNEGNSTNANTNSSSNSNDPDQNPPIPQVSPQPLGKIPASPSTPTPTHRTLIAPTGNPGPPPPGPVSPEVQSTFSNLRSEASYLLASVIPVLLTTLLSIPIQVYSSSLNCLLPFRALTRNIASGAAVQDTLLLSRNPSLLSSQLTSFRFLKRYKDPLPFVSMLLGILSLVLVPISSEVIRLELTSDCDLQDFYNRDSPGQFLKVCAFGLRKSGGLIRVAEVILCVMGLLVLLLGVLLKRWRSGINSHGSVSGAIQENGKTGAGYFGEPWSIAHMTGLLATCDELACLLRNVNTGKDTDVKREMKMALKGMRFRLGWFIPATNHSGPVDQPHKAIYGLQFVHQALEDEQPFRLTQRDPPNRKTMTVETNGKVKGPGSWFTGMANELSLRVLATLFTVGLLGLILVYENTIAPDTAFERFMDSQSFGVRILFTVFGTIISLFWGYYFSQTSESQIHRHLALADKKRTHNRRGLPAEQSIYLSPPSDVFVGLYRSVFHKRDFHSFNIAFAALLAKFTPILLSNIPFYNTVTFNIHEACTWMAVIVLGYMILVVVGGLILSCGWSCKETVPKLCRSLRDAQHGRDNSAHKPKQGGILDGEKSNPVDLPVKVDTMAGCMYYVCDSRMLQGSERSLVGHSVGDGIGSSKKTGLSLNMGAENRYFLGELTGLASGEKRVGVDYFHGLPRS